MSTVPDDNLFSRNQIEANQSILIGLTVTNDHQCRLVPKLFQTTDSRTDISCVLRWFLPTVKPFEYSKERHNHVAYMVATGFAICIHKLKLFA